MNSRDVLMRQRLGVKVGCSDAITNVECDQSSRPFCLFVGLPARIVDAAADTGGMNSGSSVRFRWPRPGRESLRRSPSGVPSATVERLGVGGGMGSS